MHDLPSTRYSLLLRIQDPQNHAAWTEFIEIYQPLVYGLARRKGFQDADAQNVCQEVFQVVAKAAHEWSPDRCPGSFRGWLFGVARNLIANAFRQQKRQARGTGDSEVKQMLENQSASEDIAELMDTEYRRNLFHLAARSVKCEFSASTWQAFWQTAVESREINAVAAELGISAGAVYIARSRVVARLAWRVKQIEGEE